MRYTNESEDGITPRPPCETAQLLECAREITIFRNPDGQPFAILGGEQINDFLCVPLHSPDFRAFLLEGFFARHDRFPRDSCFRTVRDLLDSRCAKRTWTTPPVALRIAHGKAHRARQPGDLPVIQEALALDLGDSRVLEASATGWAVNTGSDFNFLQPRGLHCLPTPQPAPAAAPLDELRQLLRIDPQGWLRVQTWLLAALRPKGPYPILVLQGPAGSGKSTAARLLRTLIDPTEAPLAALPPTPNALLRHAHRNWICAFDHVTGVPKQISAALCRLSTRAAYTLREDVSINISRPILLTTPTDAAGAAWKPRADLLQRTLTVTLPALTPETTRPEEELDQTFAAAHPRYLAALADAMSAAMAHQPQIHLKTYPRHADAAVWAIAAASALNTTQEAIQAALQAANEFQKPRDPLQAQIEVFMETRGHWKGTATQLKQDLDLQIAANQLSRRLKEVMPMLNSKGITVLFDHPHKERVIEINKKQPPEPENRTNIVAPAEPLAAQPDTALPPPAENHRSIVAEALQAPKASASPQYPEYPDPRDSSSLVAPAEPLAPQSDTATPPPTENHRRIVAEPPQAPKASASPQYPVYPDPRDSASLVAPAEPLAPQPDTATPPPTENHRRIVAEPPQAPKASASPPYPEYPDSRASLENTPGGPSKKNQLAGSKTGGWVSCTLKRPYLHYRNRMI